MGFIAFQLCLINTSPPWLSSKIPVNPQVRDNREDGRESPIYTDTQKHAHRVPARGVADSQRLRVNHGHTHNDRYTKPKVPVAKYQARIQRLPNTATGIRSDVYTQPMAHKATDTPSQGQAQSRTHVTTGIPQLRAHAETGTRNQDWQKQQQQQQQQQ